MPKSSDPDPTPASTGLLLPPLPLSFLFVRHGETPQNRDGVRCGGDIDAPMTEGGCDRMRRVGKILAGRDHGIGLIVTSDLTRTRQSALILNEELGGLPLRIEPLLNERSLGQWNGLSIAETEPLLHAGMTPPDGEGEAEYQARIERALAGMTDFLPRRPLIVGSKGTARMLCKILGGKDRLNLENAAVVEFTLVPGGDGEHQLRITFVV